MRHAMLFPVYAIFYAGFTLHQVWVGDDVLGALSCMSIFYVGGALAKMIEEKKSGKTRE